MADQNEQSERAAASAHSAVRSGWAALALAAALVAAPETALAQDEYGRSGLYVGGSWMRAVENFRDDIDEELNEVLPEAATDVDVDDFQSYGGVLGLRSSPHWSVELVGERYRELSIDVISGGDAVSADLELRAAMLMTKFFILTGPVQPYLMAGVGLIEARAESGGLSDRGRSGMGRLGLGFDMYLTPNVVLGLQASYSRAATSDFDDISFFSAGGNALLRF
jgi:opacity protein-like surface antigen